MELGSIWLGGFRFGALDCPPGTPEPKEFTKPTPALLTRAVERTREGRERFDWRQSREGITKDENMWIQACCHALYWLVTGFSVISSRAVLSRNIFGHIMQSTIRPFLKIQFRVAN